VSLTAEARLPVLDERLVVGGELGTYRGSLAAETVDGRERIDASITALPALARMAYRMPFDRLEMWSGVGMGVAFTITDARSPSTGTVTERSSHIAASAFAGAAFRLGRGALVVEASYLHASIPSGAIHGRIGGITMCAGYGIEL